MMQLLIHAGIKVNIHVNEMFPEILRDIAILRGDDDKPINHLYGVRYPVFSLI